MKKIVMTMFALLALTAAQAQSEAAHCDNGNSQCNGKHRQEQCCDQQRPQRKHMTAQQRTDSLAKRLNLTADQKAKVLALNNKCEASRQQKADAKKQAKVAKDQVRANRKAYNDEMKQILTPEQYQQYEKMCHKFHKHHGGKGHHGKRFCGPRGKNHKHGNGPRHHEGCDSIQHNCNGQQNGTTEQHCNS